MPFVSTIQVSKMFQTRESATKDPLQGPECDALEGAVVLVLAHCSRLTACLCV
jgi:hypothetical protein